MTYLEAIARQFPALKIEKDIPLSAYTTLKVGGRADAFAAPAAEDEICGLVQIARQYQTPLLVLGNGSNTLVRDGGFRGLVMQIGRAYGSITLVPGGLYAQSGALMSVLSRTALEKGFTGLEFAQGIPGSVGGGVYMNAGAYGGEMGQVIRRVRVFDGREKKWVDAREMDFSYRHTRAMDEKWIILGAEYRLEKGEPQQIEEKMKDFAARRKEKQPLEYPSAGSFFKRPEGHYAGALIEQSHLKGKQIGGAQVSEKHAGFLINKGGATAKDFLELMEYVQNTVEKNFGVHLENEVRIVGSEK